MKLSILNKLNPQNRITVLFVIISILILLCLSSLFQVIHISPEPQTDFTSMKVTVIMQMYNCHNPEIYEAIMQTFDPVLVATVIAIESEFQPDAVSPAGARGLMQLTPDKLDDWKNVTKNITTGSSYLKEQLDRFGDLDLAMAAYNAGPGSVIKYRGIPPFKETIQYVKKAKLVSVAVEKLLSEKIIDSDKNTEA